MAFRSIQQTLTDLPGHCRIPEYNIMHVPTKLIGKWQRQSNKCKRTIKQDQVNNGRTFNVEEGKKEEDHGVTPPRNDK